MRASRFSHFIQYWNTLCLLFALTLLSGAIEPLVGYKAVGFVFLLGVLLVGFLGTLGPVLFAALLSALVWNFFFIPPRFTFAISQPDDLIMCLAYLIGAVITGALTSRSRRHELLALEREERALFLSEILTDISNSRTEKEILSNVADRVQRRLGVPCRILAGEEKVSAVEAGLGFSIPGLQGPLGLLILAPDEKQNFVLSAEAKLNLQSVCQQVGLSLERVILEKKLAETERFETSEKLHQTLLNSISHELRTPLTAIVGAATSLGDGSAPETPEFRQVIAGELTEACDRLNRVIENLLDMSRLNSGAMAIRPEWHDLHDLLGVVLKVLKRNLQSAKIEIEIPENLPLIHIDFRLMEHALANLILNAATYSPKGSPIRIRAGVQDLRILIRIEDRGPGLPPEKIEQIFEKFYRLPGTPAGGLGLGLSIVKSIVEFHHGTLQASNRPEGGAVFTVALPLGTPPSLPREGEHGHDEDSRH